jgi:hypothetical protein
MMRRRQLDIASHCPDFAGAMLPLGGATRDCDGLTPGSASSCVRTPTVYLRAEDRQLLSTAVDARESRRTHAIAPSRHGDE